MTESHIKASEAAGQQRDNPELCLDEPESEARTQRDRSENLRKWLIRFGVLAAILLIILFVIWYTQRPQTVGLIQPTQASITETISGSGVVGGETESNVGAQLQGIVRELYVKEGDIVSRGQQLAVIKNDVAEAQMSQAQAAVSTARAQLAQVSREALSSDVSAAVEQVNQAKAQVEQQLSVINQSEKGVEQGRSVLEQLESERGLAATELKRSESLLESGDIARSDYDRAYNAFSVSDKRVKAQKQSIEALQANVRSAQSSLRSLQANARVLQARLRTIKDGARPEDIQVAQNRLAEAEKALRVAEQQAGNAVVTAPFAGAVTKINTETGQTVGNLGVLTLVSIEPEIRLDIDESNLSELKVGQEAVISSDAFSGDNFTGRVSELGAAVDQVRGTITVNVVPEDPPEWLRPGQTVNVNIITAKNVSRLLIPQTAPVRIGDETVVFLIKDGRVIQKPVVTRLPTTDGIPVISGLDAGDLIIANPSNLRVGDEVRAR